MLLKVIKPNDNNLAINQRGVYISYLLSGSFLLHLLNNDPKYSMLNKELDYIDTNSNYFKYNDVIDQAVINFVILDSNKSLIENPIGVDIYNKIEGDYEKLDKIKLKENIKHLIEFIKTFKDDYATTKSLLKGNLDNGLYEIYNLNYSDDATSVFSQLFTLHDNYLSSHTHNIYICNFVPIIFFFIYCEIYDYIKLYSIISDKEKQLLS
jgi:hypothetical protein